MESGKLDNEDYMHNFINISALLAVEMEPREETLLVWMLTKERYIDTTAVY